MSEQQIFFVLADPSKDGESIRAYLGTDGYDNIRAVDDPNIKVFKSVGTEILVAITKCYENWRVLSVHREFLDCCAIPE